MSAGKVSGYDGSMSQLISENVKLVEQVMY